MINKFHGIDRHKQYSTIAVLNRKREEIDFTPRCSELKGYIDQLGAEDAVIMEALHSSKIQLQKLWVSKVAIVTFVSRTILIRLS